MRYKNSTCTAQPLQNFTDSILNNIVSILELLCIPNTTISNEELKLRKRDLKLTPPVCEMLIKLKPVAGTLPDHHLLMKIEPSGMHNVIQQLMTLEPQQGIKMSSCSLMQQDNLTYFTKLSGTTYLLNLSKVSRGTTLVRILQFVQLAPGMMMSFSHLLCRHEVISCCRGTHLYPFFYVPQRTAFGIDP